MYDFNHVLGMSINKSATCGRKMKPATKTTEGRSDTSNQCRRDDEDAKHQSGAAMVAHAS